MGLMDWLLDRWWAWKNSAALDQLEAESAEIDALKARVDRRMEEAFGPDWREQQAKRIARVLPPGLTSE